LRHATSNLNESLKVGDFNDENLSEFERSLKYYKVALKPKNRDACLSQSGITEAVNQRALIHSLDFNIVLCSPMKRALQTAILCAAGMKNKPTKIILIPELRETMTFKNTVASSSKELQAFVQGI
jgi:phosphohistidine phosphatase SixA